jgi:hypothetical protein
MSFTRYALTLSITFATVSISQLASAQDALYFVVTNDGSQYQGQLVENVVGQHVTIRLASGEIRTFQAAEVRAQGNVGGVAPPPVVQLQEQAQALAAQMAQVQSAALAGTPGGPPITYNGPDAVQVHITKSNNGEGSLFMESASGWQRVCTMPCSTTVDPKIDYRLHNSDAFRFPAGPPLDLVADSGGRRTFQAIGWTLVSVSLVSWIPGLLFQLNAFDGSNAVTPAEQTHSSSNGAIAGVFYGVSGALLVAGIIFVAIHPSASLTTADGARRIVKRSGVTLTPTGLSF